MFRTYTELCKFDTYEDRYAYLKLDAGVGIETFGFDRFLNQQFYKSKEWRDVRREVIIRDDGMDLGSIDRPIQGNVLVHHMNPIRQEQIVHRDPDILNPEYLICVSLDTHNAIHFGAEAILPPTFVERQPNDTRLW